MPEQANPDNLLGIDYRQPLPRRLGDLQIIDAHVHLRGGREAINTFFEAAKLYGIRRVLSMTHVDLVDEVEHDFPGLVDFIAVPNYRAWENTAAFQQEWLRDIGRFAARGSRLCKFWMAPRALAERHLTLQNPWLRPMIDAALDAGMAFMVHVADPDIWFATRYADSSKFGTKQGCYPQLEWFLEYVSPRPVIGAHFVGNPEDLEHLDQLFARHPNLMLDVSATKWIVREISRHRPSRVRQFFRRHRERILFGSDLVIDPVYDFDHYASRYWVHQAMWETDRRGISPIQDPDAPDGQAPVRGVRLPDDILRAIYRDNVESLFERVKPATAARKS